MGAVRSRLMVPSAIERSAIRIVYIERYIWFGRDRLVSYHRTGIVPADQELYAEHSLQGQKVAG